MKKGFSDSNFDVQFELPREEVNRLLKQYKKLKKYRKSSIYTLKLMDGSEELISSILKEFEDE